MKDIERHSSNPAEIEDPTSERIAGARSATFGLLWPHDGKKGWVCQSEKMVTGGWYFCPNEESNDLASCAYCKLSLDGWEPKDDPYEEHYRRSSDCSFFVFAQNPNKKTKAGRPKKSRTSKASRLSTQSTTSEAPTVDMDDQIDESLMSETTSKTKSTKKKSKSKAKTTKSKKADTAEAGDQIGVDGTEYADPEPPKPKRATRGKKRPSEEVSQGYGNEVDTETTDQPEPVPKRRATRTRNSTIQQDYSDLNDTAPAVTQEQSEEAPQEEEPKKGRRTKKNTTKGRKVSETSSTLRAAPASRVPDDAELDAQLEADLEADPPSPEEQRTETATKQTSKKSKSSKKSKPSPEVQDQTANTNDDHEMQEDEIPEDDQVEPVEVETVSRTQTKPSKSAGKRKAKGSKLQDKDFKLRESPEVDRGNAETAVPQRHESLVSVEIATKKPEQISDAELLSEEEAPKPKKASTGKSKKPKKTSRPSVASPKPKEEDEGDIEDAREQEPAKVDTPEQREATPEQELEQEEQPEDQFARRRSSRRSSNIPPKTVERYSDIPQEKQFTRSFTGSRSPDTPVQAKDVRHSGRQASGAVSPLPSTSRGSPSLSPQSSDAENQPPSTKPSASRNFAPSPSKQPPSVRAPLAVSTPSPSKRNANAGGLKTSHPWTPIDIESIIFARDGDKENASPGGKASGTLTSPEKKMTVEEWILWSAKNGEERLKQECERLVSQFEKEGGRAMRVLEGIECID